MKKAIYLLAIGSIIGIFAACSSSLYKPTLETAGSPERFQELNKGRALYIANCSSCHNLHKPSEYSETGWIKNLNDMQKKAEITDSEKKLILNYLTSK
ncbi:MAG: hypothetical protein ABI390_11180 [Daejeonella sp.]